MVSVGRLVVAFQIDAGDRYPPSLWQAAQFSQPDSAVREPAASGPLAYAIAVAVAGRVECEIVAALEPVAAAGVAAPAKAAAAVEPVAAAGVAAPAKAAAAVVSIAAAVVQVVAVSIVVAVGAVEIVAVEPVAAEVAFASAAAAPARCFAGMT